MSQQATTGLTLLLGPANSGKLGRVLEWWQERLPCRPVVVVPTGPDAAELTAEMVRRATGLIDQAGAVTFDGLVKLLLGRSPRYATDLERDLVISKALREVPTSALTGSTRLPGAVPALASLLRQLSESGREADEVEAIFARWAAGDSTVAGLADDVLRLAASCRHDYRQLGLEDRPSVVRDVATGPEVANWRRPVAFYGFTSFTPGQRLLVERLAQKVEVLVTFTYDPDREVNLSTPTEISWWRSRSKRVVEAAPGSRAYHSPAIAYLDLAFMNPRQPEQPPPATSDEYGAEQGVRFLLASGRRAEAELAAEQVGRLLRAGSRPTDIAVVVRHVPSWSPLIARVFESCGIPVAIDERPALGRTGLGHAFLKALRGAVFDDGDAFLAYLRSPYSGLPPDAATNLELAYRRGSERGAGVLARMARTVGLDEVGVVWSLFSSTDTEPAGRLDVCAAAALAERLLVAGIRNGTPCSADVEEDARAFRTLNSALARLAELDSALQASSSCRAVLDCHSVLRVLDSLPVGSSSWDEGRGAVQVMSVQRARARRFPIVFLLGLIEGEFPGGSDAPSLLTPEQRAQLDSIGGGLFGPESENEAALFVSAVSRASRLLFLSARNAEDDGSEAVPSRFWEWSRSLLGADDSGVLIRTLGDQVYSPASALTSRQYERACAALGLTDRIGGPAERVPSWNRMTGCLSHPAVLAELAGAQRFNPSALETYARCPFAWFIERAVGVEELERHLDGRCVGQLLHAALSDIYQRLDSAGQLPLRVDQLQPALELADGVISNLVAGPDCPGSKAERRLAGWELRRMVRRLFDLEIESSWPFVPAQQEMWIGGPEGVDVGGFRIHGRIDRLDTDPGGAGVFVIDYKSGSIPSPSALGGAEALQLPLYLLALGAGRPGSRVLGGAYLDLSEGKRSGVLAAGQKLFPGGVPDGCRVLDETHLDELFARTRMVSQEAVEGMRRGDIAPRSGRNCPPWCDLAPVCRARRGGYRP